MSKSGDSISRSWVEHNILSLVDPETRFYAKQRLDDAPPVETYTPEQVKDLVDLNKKLSEERLQGEWIIHIDDLWPEDSTEECSICHEEQRLVGNDDNFCPNCGADMRKGGTE